MVINLEQIQFDLCKTELVPCLVVGFFPNSLFGKCIDVLFIVICELQVIHRKISNKKKKKGGIQTNEVGISLCTQ